MTITTITDTNELPRGWLLPRYFVRFSDEEAAAEYERLTGKQPERGYRLGNMVFFEHRKESE